MKIKMRYFGMIAEAMTKGEELLDLDIKTAGDLNDYLIRNHNNLEGMMFQISVNQNIASLEFEIHENDEVALLPAFAGG